MINIKKTITFNLTSDSSEISLPDLISKQHVRNHVVLLFKELESKGFGCFQQGKQGRGNSSKFIKNDNCPTSYDLILTEKQRGRPRKIIDTKTIDFNPTISADEDMDLSGSVAEITLSTNTSISPDIIIDDNEDENQLDLESDDLDEEEIPF